MILPIGRYLPQHNNGSLINDCSWEKVPAHWKEVITIVQNAYQEHSSLPLHSVYLRGSVAAGTAIDGRSDLDTFAVVKNRKVQWQELPWGKELETSLQKKFPFVREVEICQTGINNNGNIVNPRIIPILKLQSICLWGENLIPQLPDFFPSRALAKNYRWLAEDLQILRKADQYPKAMLQSSLKTILRSGFEWVMEKEGKYTTDLYPCYRSFVHYYPEWEPQMKQVLAFYLELPTEKQRFIPIVEELGQQLLIWFEDW